MSTVDSELMARMQAAGVLGPALRLVLPNHPPSLNKVLAMSIRQRIQAKKQWHNDVGWSARAQWSRAPLAHAHIVVRLVRPDTRFYDPDNAYTCAKWAIDPLRKLVIADDSPQHISLDVRQERGEKRQTVIEVWPKEET